MTTKSQPQWLCVLESDGRRRCPDKPRLWVATCGVEPGAKLEQHVQASKRWQSRQVTEVRYDLMPRPGEQGGRDQPFILPTDEGQSREAKKVRANALKADGYTIGNDLTTWHLYAIELKPPSKASEPVHGYLYVGQTSLAVEDRIEQHRLGPEYPWHGKAKHSKECHKRFLRPRLDLLSDIFRQTYFSSDTALDAEADLRLHFEGLGYEVVGGKERYEARKTLAEERP